MVQFIAAVADARLGNLPTLSFTSAGASKSRLLKIFPLSQRPFGGA